MFATAPLHQLLTFVAPDSFFLESPNRLNPFET